MFFFYAREVFGTRALLYCTCKKKHFKRRTTAIISFVSSNFLASSLNESYLLLLSMKFPLNYLNAFQAQSSI